MRYRTKDGNDYSLEDRGTTVNGVIETDKPIENPNFELIQEDHTPPVQALTQPEVIPTLSTIANADPTPPQPSVQVGIPQAQPQDILVPPAPQINEQKEQI